MINNTNKKNFIFKLILPIIIVLAILVLATIFDLQFSQAICILPYGEYFCYNTFVIICDVFGESVLYVLLLVAIFIIFNYFLKKHANKKWAKTTILMLLAVLGLFISLFFVFKTLENYSYYASDKFLEFCSYPLTKIFFCFVAIAIEISAFLVLNRLQQNTLKNLFKWAVIVIVVCLISNLMVKLLKIIVNRTRYRAMLYVGDTEFTYYTNWFKFNKNTFPSLVSFGEDFFKSFPSGHACAAASIFNLCLLPQFLKNNNKKVKISLILISTIYTVVVCFSRVLCGAHFLTDVLIGALIAICFVFLVNLLFNKIFNKFFDKMLNK